MVHTFPGGHVGPWFVLWQRTTLMSEDCIATTKQRSLAHADAGDHMMLVVCAIARNHVEAQDLCAS